LKNKLLFCFVIIPGFVFSQDFSRVILKGVLISDFLDVESIPIFNKTANNNVLTDKFGVFKLYAKENDTLIISSLAFETKKIILKKADFENSLLEIHLDAQINEIDEVKIGAFKLTGDLFYDSKRIKIKPKLKSDLPKIDLSNIDITGVKTTENKAIPNTSKSLGGIDFIKIGGSLIGLLTNPKPKTVTVEKDFIPTIREKYSETFFLETLQLKKEEIFLFLNYCDSNLPKDRDLLEKEKQLELMEFLIKMSKQFRE
jgi:hypothetical protein